LFANETHSHKNKTSNCFFYYSSRTEISSTTMTNRKKKVLITGANGLLGSNLVRLLCNKYHVRLLVRPGSDLKTIKNLNCEFYYGDICVAEDVRDAVNDCNFVVHAASLTTQWGVTYSDYKLVNITDRKSVVEDCL